MEGELVGRKNFGSEENNGKWPKGCYLAHGSSGEPDSIWWNNHPSGSPNSRARQICIVGKEGGIVNI